MSKTTLSSNNQRGLSRLRTVIAKLVERVRCRQDCSPRSVPGIVISWLELRVPSSPRIRTGLNAAVGGVLSALAGAAMAASPSLWGTMNPDTLTLIQLALVGAVIGLGQGMAADPPLTIRQTLGRALQSTGIALSAGLTIHLVPDASPIVVIAAGALLATVGTDALRDLWGHFIRKGS